MSCVREPGSIQYIHVKNTYCFNNLVAVEFKITQLLVNINDYINKKKSKILKCRGIGQMHIHRNVTGSYYMQLQDEARSAMY